MSEKNKNIIQKEHNVEKISHSLIFVILTLGAVISFLFSIVSYIQGNMMLVAGDLICATILSSGLFFIYIRKKHNVFVYSMCLTGYTMFMLFLFVSGGESNTGYMWMFTLPFVTFPMVGRKQGIIIVSSIVAFFQICFWTSLISTEMRLFSIAFKISFSMSFIIVSGVAYLYEIVKTQIISNIINKNAELEKNEQILRKAQEKYQMLSENLHDSIAVISDQYINYINQRFLNTTGYSKAELVGSSIFDHIDATEKYKILKYYKKETLCRDIVEIQVKHKNGSIVFFEITCTYIEIQGKSNILVIFRDVTKRKDQEKQKEIFIKKQREIDKLKVVAQLSGCVAHELNNTFCVINGCVEMIERNIDNSKSAALLNTRSVIGEIRNISKLIDNLLAFSQIGDYTQRSVSVNTRLDHIINIIKKHTEKNIQFNIQFSEYDVISADEDQIDQIFLNILQNAVDAVKHSGTITIETVSTQQQNIPKLKIKISDNGCGMSQYSLQHMYDPFFTTRSSEKHSGLGMTAVYGAVKKNGGTITVTSEENNGTTVELMFSLECAIKSPVTKISDKNNRSLSILIVDDNEMLREMMQEMLEMFGYSVFCCADGLSGIEFYKRNYTQIDLVLLDMVMPKMNGDKCFEQLKQINPQIRSIIISGHAFNDEIKGALHNGVLEFIKKPFNMETFSKILEKIT